MSYIGKAPGEHFTSFQTETFSVSVTTSYTLSYAVANENELALFINNVRQQPGSGKAYTASGTALTLSAATASTDTMYAIYLGRALQTITPSTNSITSGMLGSAFFTGATDVGAAIADADLFLMDDGAGGTLRKTAASRIKTYVGGGLSVADQWRLTADQSAGTNADVTSNLERVDTDGFGQLGSGMTESSGIFTFPSTGIYFILVSARITAANSDSSADVIINTTTDNSSYGQAAIISSGVLSSGGAEYSVSNSFIFDVTSTSTHKFKITTASHGSSYIQGATDSNETTITILKLGDT